MSGHVQFEAWQKKKVFGPGCVNKDIWKPSISCGRSAAHVTLTARKGHTLLERKLCKQNWRWLLCLSISWTQNKRYSDDLQEIFFIWFYNTCTGKVQACVTVTSMDVCNLQTSELIEYIRQNNDSLATVGIVSERDIVGLWAWTPDFLCKTKINYLYTNYY